MAEREHVVSIEFDSREAGETSSGATDQETQTREIEIHPTLEERFKIMTEAGVENAKNQSSAPKIQKVIFLLRDHQELVKYYEPRVVSLGPIHHGNEKYQHGEKFKLVLACEFIQGSGKTKEEVYNKIKEKINELRKCFEEEVTRDYDDEALSWLLFVDGCAVLQYIYCATNELLANLSIKNDSVAFANQDLFLLENQLPYCLLEWLMNLSNNKDELRKSIDTFINAHVEVPVPEYHSSILRCACLSKLSWNYSTRRKQKQAENDHSKKKTTDPIHLLDLLRTSLLDNHDQRIKPKKLKGPYNWQSYRNVQELRAAGIYVERSRNKKNCLSDIYFTKLASCFGYLWLPPITVDDSTKPNFLNLIAYEMSLDFKNNFGITSYISFLDSLIDEANDVKMLRKVGVLYNCLGSDEEVAKLFNEIGTDLVPSIEIYSDVRSEIQKYYNNTLRNWIAQFVHDHFSSPWTFFALTGALLALGLTAAQTFYAGIGSPCDDFCKNLSRNLTCKR